MRKEKGKKRRKKELLRDAFYFRLLMNYDQLLMRESLCNKFYCENT